jgi:5S rRNA maturation endonuclease (ribonuclease M5)
MEAFYGSNIANTKKLYYYAPNSHDALTDLTAEKFSNVVILTDFDEQGTILNKKLAKLFETRGVKLDRFYRSRFRKLQFLDGNQIEKCEKSAFWTR